MLENRNKAFFPDLNKKNDVGIEINWNQNTKDVVKINIGDKEAVIKMEDLYGFVVMSVSGEKQDNLIPVRQTTITKYIKQHKIMAGKNIKKGEYLVVNCEIDVPRIVEEGLRGSILSKRKSSLSVI